MFFSVRNAVSSSVRFLAAAILLLLISCDSAQEAQSKVKTYYDVKGFIETQIFLLDKQKPEVSKIMQVGEKKETLSGRDLDWRKELELFVQADINKPAYSKSYLVSKPDSFTIAYTLKPGETLPVRFLKISLDKNSGNPSSIEALLRSENKLYQSEKRIELHGSNRATNQWQLESYSIKGFQQLATMDRKLFDIAAAVKP
jgi:hypothetical protein